VVIEAVAITSSTGAVRRDRHRVKSGEVPDDLISSGRTIRRAKPVAIEPDDVARPVAGVPILMFAVIVTPLAFWPRGDDVFARPKLVILVVFGVAGAVLVAQRILLRPRSSIKINAIDVGVLVFVVLNVAAYLASVNRGLSLWGEPLQYQGIVAVAIYCVSYAVARVMVRGTRAVRGLFAAASAGGVAVAGYAVAQRAGLDPIWDELPDGRVFSSIGQPNALAAYLVMVVPLTAALAVTGGRLRFIWAIGLAAEVVAIFLTISRGGVLGLIAVGLVFLGLRVRGRRAWFGAFRAGVVATLLVAAAAILVPQIQSSVGDVAGRSVPGVDEEASQSVRLHFDLWLVASHIAVDYPMLGTGQDTFPEVFPAYRDEVLSSDRAAEFVPYRVESPHNVYLATATSAGLPALTSYIGILVALLAVCRGQVRGATDPQHQVIGVALTAAVVWHLVTDSFMTVELAGSYLFWVLLGVASAWSLTDRAEPSHLRESCGIGE
jgi:O-antigen ligase